MAIEAFVLYCWIKIRLKRKPKLMKVKDIKPPVYTTDTVNNIITTQEELDAYLEDCFKHPEKHFKHDDLLSEEELDEY